MDFSTIKLDELKRLRSCTLPPTYQLQREPGNGCSGDAPGFPSYFTRSVYTQHGNNPPRGAQLVLSYNGVQYVISHHDDWKGCADWDAFYAKIQRRLRRIWNALPLDHPRTQAWIRDTYRHHAHCYTDAERPENGRPGILIYPVPDYKLKHFHDDPRWSEEYRQAASAEVAEFNRQERERAEKIAVPENHSAVRIIRSFYPEYTPDADQGLISNPPKQVGGCWWETEATQPTPETCRPRSCEPHPINGEWCQWCGWHKE
jgi:hypothetical protein